jgi:hypothetical protein
VDRPPPRTLLERLVQDSDRTAEEVCQDFEACARQRQERATLSVRQLGRWMAGDVGSARPSARRVAQALWGHSFKELLGPPTVPPAGVGLPVATPDRVAVTQVVSPGGSGTVATLRDEGIDDVNRQAFLRVLAATMAGAAAGDPTAEAIGRPATGQVPARVGAAEVEQLRHANELFAGWQDRYGGGACRDAIAGQVSWATRLLGAEATEETRAELHRVIGFLVNIAGWGAFDAGYHDDARRYFRLALHCADQGRDWGLRANVLSDMARQAVYVGRPDDGLSFIELAQVRQDRQTPTARAMLSGVRARTLAKLGRAGECQGAVRAAEDHFADRQPDDDPDWIAYFDEAELHGEAGHAMLDVALDGHYLSDARDRLHRALAGYPAEQVRSRALTVGKLAILELGRGDPHAGVVYARQAVTTNAPLRSARAMDDLEALDQALSSRSGISGAQDVREQIRTLTDPTNRA